MIDSQNQPTLAELGQRFAEASEKYNPQDADHVRRAEVLACKIGNAERSIPIIEEAIKILKAAREGLGYRILDLMDEAETSKTTLNNGLTVAVDVSPTIDYQLPPDASDELIDDAKARLVAWFADHGEAASVKEIIQLKGGVEAVTMQAVLEYLDDCGLNYTRAPTIHYQTLKKILKTRITTGEEMPPADVALVKMHRFISVK
jgi:ParB-like chromosome segregation protein Spo0J